MKVISGMRRKMTRGRFWQQLKPLIIETLLWWPGDPESKAEDAENMANSQAANLFWSMPSIDSRISAEKCHENMALEALSRSCQNMVKVWVFLLTFVLVAVIPCLIGNMDLREGSWC